jgi:hypothetical protein
MHPLSNISSLSIEQLELRVADLSKRYFQTQNPQIHSQITLLIEEAKEEIRFRNARKKLEEEQQKSESDDESGLDNLINVS